MSLINVKDLSLGYEGRVIVENLSFKIEQGDYLCIVGDNGSGKSTLLKTILGLQSPLKGNVTFGDGCRRNEVGYLPQQTQVQRDFPASVREIVLSGCQNKTGFRIFYNKDEKESAAYNMKRLGIEEFGRRSYRKLSGGQQQKVLLARALCATRRLLLLDEPVAGLDPGAMKDMYSIIESLNKEGITIVMISHDVEAALKYATHILHVKRNSIFATKEEYDRGGTC